MTAGAGRRGQVHASSSATGSWRDLDVHPASSSGAGGRSGARRVGGCGGGQHGRGFWRAAAGWVGWFGGLSGRLGGRRKARCGRGADSFRRGCRALDAWQRKTSVRMTKKAPPARRPFGGLAGLACLRCVGGLARCDRGSAGTSTRNLDKRLECYACTPGKARAAPDDPRQPGK